MSKNEKKRAMETALRRAVSKYARENLTREGIEAWVKGVFDHVFNKVLAMYGVEVDWHRVNLDKSKPLGKMLHERMDNAAARWLERNKVEAPDLKPGELKKLNKHLREVYLERLYEMASDHAGELAQRDAEKYMDLAVAEMFPAGDTVEDTKE